MIERERKRGRELRAYVATRACAELYAAVFDAGLAWRLCVRDKWPCKAAPQKNVNGTAKNVQRKAKSSNHALSLTLSAFFPLLLLGPHLPGSAVADFYRLGCSLCR